jgi:hypothetical protein
VLTRFIRAAGLLGLLVASAPVALAANQKEIDNALKGGTEYLKARYARAGVGPGVGPGVAPVIGPVGTGGDHGIGPTALTGLALLEGGVPVTDPAVKNITDMVRDASYKQTKTYQISLCLMYLDRYGDPNDTPLIQMLAIRLLVGQVADGGWGYDCITAVGPQDEQRLRANLKETRLVAGPGGAKGPPKLHEEVEKYGQALLDAKRRPGGVASGTTDNSNTQFAVLAVWMARKHGAPVEDALDLIEKRFLTGQNARTGGWSYMGAPANAPANAFLHGSPAMFCSGLLGMSTALARREERRLKKDPPAGPKPDAPAKPDKPNDPFYNPPPAVRPRPRRTARARPTSATSPSSAGSPGSG